MSAIGDNNTVVRYSESGNSSTESRYDLSFLPLDQAIASRAVFVIVTGWDRLTGGRTETLLEPAK